MSKDVVYFEGEFDSDDGGKTPTAIRLDQVSNLARNLTGRRLHDPLQPLRDVYVLNAQDANLPPIIRDEFRRNPVADPYSWDTARYNKLKPEYVRAYMTANDMNLSATMSTRNKTLARIIRARGFKGDDDRDDCGHIVAKWLGGPFVDYNLYPQSFALNRGFNFLGLPNFGLWKAMEMFMVFWLRLKGNNPKVELTVRLRYNDADLVDRPSDMTFSVRFLAGEDDDEDEEGKTSGRDIIHVVRNLMNTSNMSLQSPQTLVNASQTYAVMTEFFSKCNMTRSELLGLLKKLRTPIPVPCPPKVPVQAINDAAAAAAAAAQMDRMTDMLSMFNPMAGAAAKVMTGRANKEEIVKTATQEIVKNAVFGAFGGFGGMGKFGK